MGVRVGVRVTTRVGGARERRRPPPRPPATAPPPPLTPYCRDPALMRVIHSALISRFLARRSRKAYCRLFSTRSRAMRMQFLARPLNPLASLRILALFIIVTGGGRGAAAAARW